MATLNDFKNGFAFTAEGAGTLGPFTILGGRYAVSVSATWGGGSVQINMSTPDGTFVPATSAAYTANGSDVLDLPAGQLQVVITTASNVAMAVVPVPYRPAP